MGKKKLKDLKKQYKAHTGASRDMHDVQNTLQAFSNIWTNRGPGVSPEAIFSNGFALHQAGRLHEAAAQYRAVLALNPNHFEALSLLGAIYSQFGNFEEALSFIGRSLKINPKQPGALNNRAYALKRLGRYDESLASYDRAIALKPDYAEAHNNRGVALIELGRFEEALASFDKAVNLMPDYAGAHNNRGVALTKLRRFEEAVASFDRAVSVMPAYAEAHNNRGVALKELRRFEEALASFDRAVALRPDYAEAHNNRGIALNDMRRSEEALASYDRAVALRPDYAEAHNNRGIALNDMRRSEEALVCYDRVISLKPDDAEAYYNKGVALNDLMRYEEALACYDRAISFQPGHARAHWNKGIVKLMLGDFDEGWKLYEWRWKLDNFPSPKREFPQPLWLGGESLSGKTILLHAEQGLGDTIQFCRYAGLIAGRGARVILEVDPSLKSLIASQDWSAQVIAQGEPIPPFDFHCPLLSLPFAFRTRLDNIPADIPYMKAAPTDIERWSGMLGERRRPRVGIAWSGNPAHKNDRYRSIPLSSLMPLTQCEVDLISLQKDMRSTDETVLANTSRFRRLDKDIKDFSDTAAVISLLDLVIAVDTSVAHLAGAMGKPVWILLPFFGTDWRWLNDREYSPWYPTASLLRQPRFDDWESVISEVKRKLDMLESR